MPTHFPGDPQASPHPRAGWQSPALSDWKRIETDDRNVYSFAIDPVAPATFYAGLGHHLYKSTDNGEHWRIIDLVSYPWDNFVDRIVIDPTAPSTLYVNLNESTVGGLFKSTDGGESWVNTSPFDAICALAMDPVAPSTLYVGDTYGAVGKTTDGGKSWPVYSGLAANEGVCALAIDPTMPSTLYAGTGIIWGDTIKPPHLTIFKSTDGGVSWQEIVVRVDPSHGSSVEALAIDPAAPSVLYAGTSMGLFKSIDGGKSWIDMGLGPVEIPVLAIDPVTPTTLYAGSEIGVLKSNDGGQSWINIGPSDPGRVTTLVFDPLTPSVLYAGTQKGPFITQQLP